MKYTSPTIVVPDKLLQIIVLDDDFFITNFATFVRENKLLFWTTFLIVFSRSGWSGGQGDQNGQGGQSCRNIRWSG